MDKALSEGALSAMRSQWDSEREPLGYWRSLPGGDIVFLYPRSGGKLDIFILEHLGHPEGVACGFQGIGKLFCSMTDQEAALKQAKEIAEMEELSKEECWVMTLQQAFAAAQELLEKLEG